MNRRTFIESIGILGAASFLPISCLSMTSPDYKLGYQLFSIRDEMAKDPIATLKLLKAMGYQDFEHYGFDAEKGTYYGHKASDFKKILDDLELSISSGHYAFSPFLLAPQDDLKRFVDQCIEGALTMQSSYITWPWIDPELRTIDNFKILAEKLNHIGARIKAAGLGFAYHNHGYEFDDHNGQNGYDIILSETDASLVKLQMDMYWVMHSSKYTLKELIDKQPGRYTMWHIKDMDVNTRDYTELGNGSIDYTTLLPDPKISGLEFFYIEQGGNFTHNSIQSAADSAAYFKEHLQEYL